MPDRKLNQQQKKSVWIRSALMAAFAIYIAVAISSVFIQDNAIDGCIRNGTFKTAEADNWNEASAIRRKGGDARVADTYLENAQIIRNTIPMPKGWKAMRSRTVKLLDGTKITINDRGVDSDDRMEGCKDAYPPFVPFI